MPKYNYGRRDPGFRPFSLILIVLFGAALFYFFSSFFEEKSWTNPAADLVQQQGADQRGEPVTIAARPVRGRIVGSNVNMRDAASTATGKVVHRFAGSEVVDVLDKTNQEDKGHFWYRVRYQSHVGWVYGQYVRVDQPVAEGPAT